MLGQQTLFPPSPEAPLRKRVTLDLVTSAEVGNVLRQCHYLHRPRVGRQVCYSVSVDGVVDGVIVFAYPMLSAAICGVPADELLEFARLYLHSNLPHVASCAIGKALRRLPGDWAFLHAEAKPPQLVVSWSDTTRHTGTVYRAANFIWWRRCRGSPPGNAASSKRDAREKHGDYRHDKDCWVYWLDPKLHERARQEAKATKMGGAALPNGRAA